MISTAFISICFFLPTTTDLNPSEIQHLIRTGLAYAYVEQFDSARIYFDSITTIAPENPAGSFYTGALLQLKMMDECRYDDEEEYFRFMRETIIQAESILKREDNLWAEFYLGSSYTYQAVYEGFKGNYYETFKYGVHGGRILQNIIKKDTTFYDAYLGAGSFEYFWARAARYLPVLKLAGGNASEAIRKIHVAAKESFYSGPTARNSLVFIYGEENEFRQADSIIMELLNEFPGGRTFLWNKAELRFKKKDYSSAIEHFQDLFTTYNTMTDKNYSNLAQCKLYIGKCYFELKKTDEARETLKAVISYKPHSKTYPKIKEYCREAYALLSRIF